MIFCMNCIKDTELKTMINSHKKIGVCDLCGIEKTPVYNTDEDDYLIALFEDLFDIYLEEDKFSDISSIPSLEFLKDELKKNWDIFEDHITPYMIHNIISNTCHEYFEIRPGMLKERVGLLRANDVEYLENNSIVGKYDWGLFVQSIREKYRFHTDIFQKEIFKEYCKLLTRTIKKGDLFFRARISTSKGYTKENMGAPPKEIVSAGRINPEGMSYLYLADSKETTIYETRASLHDYVCVGTFEALEDIDIIDLTMLERISVFDVRIDCGFHAINRSHLKKINEEIAKSVRSNDSTLEYLPTQYICDYIKSIPDEKNSLNQAYQGIMYKSTKLNTSYNISIFDPSSFECIDVEVISIEGVKYKY